jgi:hypothetical protein
MSVRSIFTTCRGAQMFKNLQHNVVPRSGQRRDFQSFS